MARCYEAQRFVLRGRYRAHRFELAQRAGELEIVGCDVSQHQQTHASRAVFDGQRVGRGRSGARAKAAEEVDFPCHADADLRRPRIRRLGNEVLEKRVVVRSVIEGVAADADGRKQPRTADRLSGARGAQPLGCDLDVAVLARRAADEVRQHRVTVAFPPGDFGFAVASRGGREPAGDVERGLHDGCGTSDQSEREQRGESGGNVAGGCPSARRGVLAHFDAVACRRLDGFALYGLARGATAIRRRRRPRQLSNGCELGHWVCWRCLNSIWRHRSGAGAGSRQRSIGILSGFGERRRRRNACTTRHSSSTPLVRKTADRESRFRRPSGPTHGEFSGDSNRVPSPRSAAIGCDRARRSENRGTDSTRAL